MGIIRKIIKIGNSEGITLPKGWLDELRGKHKRPIKKVIIDVSDVIIIKPQISTPEGDAIRVKESNHDVRD